MVATLMVSAKLVTIAILKITAFWSRGFDVKIFVHDVTNKILLFHSNYIVLMVISPKFGNARISMIEVILTSIFKFSNFGLAIGNPFKFYTSVVEGSKLKVRKFWGLIATLVEVTPPILNKVNKTRRR